MGNIGKIGIASDLKRHSDRGIEHQSDGKHPERGFQIDTDRQTEKDNTPDELSRQHHHLMTETVGQPTARNRGNDIRQTKQGEDDTDQRIIHPPHFMKIDRHKRVNDRVSELIETPRRRHAMGLRVNNANAEEIEEQPKKRGGLLRKRMPEEEKPAPAVKSFSIEGNAWLYFTAVTPTASKLVSGTVYAWGEENSGRLPVTKNPDGAGNLIDLLGWVDIDKLK